jgi:hypothetical protein
MIRGAIRLLFQSAVTVVLAYWVARDLGFLAGALIGPAMGLVAGEFFDIMTYV